MWWSCFKVGSRLTRIHTTDKVFGIPINGFLVLCKSWLTEISWSWKENLQYFYNLNPRLSKLKLRLICWSIRPGNISISQSFSFFSYSYDCFTVTVILSSNCLKHVTCCDLWRCSSHIWTQFGFFLARKCLHLEPDTIVCRSLKQD